MADEFEIIPNPDNVPGAISTGYQRQNTLLEAQRNGLDLSYVSPVVGQAQVTVNISGGVDVNGVLYVCKDDVILNVSTGTWYIKLVAGSTVNNVTPELTSDAGTFDSEKNGFYNVGNERILDYLLLSNGTNNVQIFKRLKNENGILLDTINEKTSGAGITLDGVLCKDSEVTTDKVNEKTSGAGITLDGVLCKDSKVRAIDLLNGSLHQSASINQNGMYNLLTNFLPSNNDKILLSGYAIYTGSGLDNETWFSFAQRADSDSIDIYGYDRTALALTQQRCNLGNTNSMYNNITLSF